MMVEGREGEMGASQMMAALPWKNSWASGPEMMGS